MDELEHDLRWPDASEAAQLAAIREELAELLATPGLPPDVSSDLMLARFLRGHSTVPRDRAGVSHTHILHIPVEYR